MFKVLCILICLLIYVPNRAQVNLILNPSFEILDSCSVYTIRLDNATDWNNIIMNPICETTLLNSCNNLSPYNNTGGGNTYQLPRTGKGYGALHIYSPPPNSSYTNFRMYSIGNLNSFLSNGKNYCGKLYINLANVSPYKINQFGMYFDDGSIIGMQTNCNTIINLIPQISNNPSFIMGDTLGWMKIEGIFTANGTENHITLGNFKDDINTVGISTGFVTNFIPAYYNIDDLSLIATEITAYAGADATICISDSIHLGRPQEVGLECLWYKPTIATPFASTSDIWFKPTQTGTYTFIQRMDNCAITWDTVNITVIQDCSLLLPSTQIPNVFTPNGDNVNDTFSFKINGTLTDFKIYNRWGLEIHQSTISNQQSTILWDGRTTSGMECTSGVYFYTLQYTDANGDTQKKNGYVTLIR